MPLGRPRRPVGPTMSDPSVSNRGGRGTRVVWGDIIQGEFSWRAKVTVRFFRAQGAGLLIDLAHNEH